ncbi:hypothetical protein PAPHI01_0093 [Pancytospora philotis]|nr:hypothetical protein PAPHI01_0093 [Pancytospora philotis]
MQVAVLLAGMLALVLCGTARSESTESFDDSDGIADANPSVIFPHKDLGKRTFAKNMANANAGAASKPQEQKQPEATNPTGKKNMGLQLNGMTVAVGLAILFIVSTLAAAVLLK